MAASLLRIGIAGCGHAARVHLGRLAALGNVRIVGCADVDLQAAEDLAASVPRREDAPRALAFADYRDLLKRLSPDALSIFTPHLAHYRPAIDALQAGCHLFIEKPLSTNVQEAVDVAGVARARGLKVGVGHHYRLLASLREARRLIAEGAIGRVGLVTATLARPWLADHKGAEDWRVADQTVAGGVLADAGAHLVDVLLWTTGQAAVEVASFQTRLGSGPDVVTAAALRLADGTPVILGISGVSGGSLFGLDIHGEAGRLRVTDRTLERQVGGSAATAVKLGDVTADIDGDFVSAVVAGTPLCCPADEALETVRLLEALSRSAATGQVVRLA